MVAPVALGHEEPDLGAILAALLLKMKRRNARYSDTPFRLDPAIVSIQQIVPENPLRKALVFAGNASGTPLFIFQQAKSTLTPQDTSLNNSSILFNIGAQGNNTGPLINQIKHVPSNAVSDISAGMLVGQNSISEGI